MKHNYYHSKHAKFGVELLITLLMVSGVLLLYTELEIQKIILSFTEFVRYGVSSIESIISALIIDPIANLEFSDGVGVLMLAISFVLFVRQFRARLVSAYFDSKACPECGHKLHRIHRTRFQQTLSSFLMLDSAFFICGDCDHSCVRFFNRSPHQPAE